MKAEVFTFALAMVLSATIATGVLPRWTPLNPDDDLARVIRAYDLRPLPTKVLVTSPKYLLGQALFFDPVLSGARDVSCATCHLPSHGTSDGLAQSIGTGGVGNGAERLLERGALLRRNSLDLWNRDNNAVVSLFWDGRVEAQGPDGSAFRSPLGSELPEGIENTLAAQSLFPLIEHGEMLGTTAVHADEGLPGPHGGMPNELAEAMETAGSVAVYQALFDRLMALDAELPDEWQLRYRDVFLAAYPETDLEDLTAAHLANAIAHFEELAFATRDTPWDRYLAGEAGALTYDQKRGALLFYGKGQCGACHSGQMLSDFEFHSVGVPSVEGQPSDFGRYEVTGLEGDRYLFRTPPLRNVTLTAPYFHNGTAATLEIVVLQHLDPLGAANGYKESGEHRMSGAEIDAISPLLENGMTLQPEETAQIISFLEALSSPEGTVPNIVPDAVPSGLSVEQ